MGGIAYVFHFAPSEIDTMTLDELARWTREANAILAPTNKG
jgi:hypothetical protein